MIERVYWPFPILKTDLSESDRREIAFLETAYREGFRPYVESSNYGAGDEATRAVFMIHRGRGRRWEPCLCEAGSWFPCNRFLAPEADDLTIFVEEFDSVSEVMLDWCRGADGRAIFSRSSFRPWGTRPRSPLLLVRERQGCAG
jgi:hypothetical protein